MDDPARPEPRSAARRGGLVTGIDPRELVRWVARRPQVVPSLAVAGWRLRRKGWWHRPPFLPVPGDRYWDFRLTTATGRTDGVLSPQQVIDAATWSRRLPSGR